MPQKEKKSQLPPVLVIFGEDPFLVSKECERVLDSLLSADDREMGLSEPGADKADAADVFDELRTLPFLASKRVVLIKAAEPFIKQHSEKLLTYLDNPSPTGTLLLTVTSWDKRTRIHKHLKKISALVEVGKLYSNQLPAYAATYAQRSYGIRLDGNSSRFLVELVGDDPGRLCREIDKLVMYVSPRNTISLRDIESLIGHNRRFDAFGVIDSVVGNQAGEAVSRIRKMFEADKSTEFSVIGAFGYHFRRLFRVKALISRGQSPQQAAAKTGIRFKQAEFLRQVSQMSLGQLSWVLAELGRIDFALKTGRSTAAISMERFILNLVAMQKNT